MELEITRELRFALVDSKRESQFGEFPWVGMVLRTSFAAGQPMNHFIGGAILIHPQVLLTAAHKVQQESVQSLNIRVGEWDIQTELEPGQYQAKNVEKLIIHPHFNNKSLYHDVALIILKEPVVLQPHIRSICMANSLDEVDQSRCVINGWGEDNFGSNNYQSVMKSVELPIVKHRRCQAMLRRTRLGRWFQLHNSFVCAGGVQGKDACRSDGGGPLACPRKGHPEEYLLVGITAWGIGCGEDGVPGVYASTIEDRSWITDQISQLIPDGHTLLKRDLESERNNEIPFNPMRSNSDDDFDFKRTSSFSQTTDGPATVTETTSTEPRENAVRNTNESKKNNRKGIKTKRQKRIERERRNRANRRRYSTTYSSLG